MGARSKTIDMFGIGRRFVAIYLTCGMISLARFSSASNSKPTDLRVESVRDLTIMLKWKRPLTTAGAPDSSVVSYTVSYQAHGSGSQRVTSTSESAEFDLQVNKKYNIYVRAVRPNQSTISDVLKVDTNNLVPAKPINLRVLKVNRLTITVVWNNQRITKTGITDTSTLNYYVSYMNLKTKARRQVQTSTEQVSLKLEAITTYEITVKSYKAFNNMVAGSWSDPLTIKTNESVPTKAPTNVKVVSSTSSSIKVSWGPIPEDYRKGVILGYVVFYREQGFMPWSERDVSVVYSKELTGLTSGKSYLVRVAGYTKMGRGAKSGPKRIIVGDQFITTTRKVTTQRPTTVSEKPHSTSTKASLTASVKTVVTVRSESTEARHNATAILTTEPHAPHSPSEASIRSSSLSSVYYVTGDNSRHSTPVADRVGRADEAPKESSLKKILIIGAPVACAFLLLIVVIVFIIGRSRKRKQWHQNGGVTKSKRRKRSKDAVTRGAFSVRYEAPSGNTTLGSDSMTEGLLHAADESDQPAIVIQEPSDSLPRAEAGDAPLLAAGNSDKYDHLRVDLRTEQKQLEEGRASGLYESIGSLGKAGGSNEAKPDEGKSDEEERYVTLEQMDATRDKAQPQAQTDCNTPNSHYQTPRAAAEEDHYKTPKKIIAKDLPEYQNLVGEDNVYETLGLKDPEDPLYENTIALPDNDDRGERNESSPI